MRKNFPAGQANWEREQFQPYAPAGSGPYQAGPPGLTSIGAQDWHPEPQHGFGIASLIVGIIGSLLGLIPILFPLVIPAGVVGIVLGCVARSKIKRERAYNRKTVNFGIGVSVLALALGLIGMFIVVAAVDKFDKDMQEITDQNQVVDIAPASYQANGIVRGHGVVHHSWDWD